MSMGVLYIRRRVYSMRLDFLRLHGRNLKNDPHTTRKAYFTKAPRSIFPRLWWNEDHEKVQKNNYRFIFAKVATVTILLRIFQELLSIEIATGKYILKTYVLPPLNVKKTVEVHTVLKAVDTSLGPFVMDSPPKSNKRLSEKLVVANSQL